MRKMWRLAVGMLCAALVNELSLRATLAGELTQAEFRRLHKLLQPAPDEAWRTIPWKISLLEAQRIAVKENKPIFIWAMDGHPLGCT